MFTGDLPRVFLKLHHQHQQLLLQRTVHTSHSVTLLYNIYTWIFQKWEGHIRCISLTCCCTLIYLFFIAEELFIEEKKSFQCLLCVRRTSTKFNECTVCQNENARTEVLPSALICSFGIVMWEILTQQKPYPGRKLFIWNESHLHSMINRRFFRKELCNTA